MALFVVAYDLNKGDTDDYKNLIDTLEALDSVHTQKSVWYVSREGTAKSLLNHLKPHVHEKDWLMVVEFTKEPEWTRAMTGTKAWLDRFFP